MTNEPKAVWCDVLRLASAHGTDCTNGGVTGREAQVRLALASSGPAWQRAVLARGNGTHGTPDLKLVDHNGTWIAVPPENPPGMVGPMFGGNYIMASGMDAPIRVHDRYETPAEYAGHR